MRQNAMTLEAYQGNYDGATMLGGCLLPLGVRRGKTKSCLILMNC